MGSRGTQEDRQSTIVVPSARGLDGSVQDAFYLSVMDGHGGQLAVNTAQRVLQGLFVKALDSGDLISEPKATFFVRSAHAR